MQNKLNMEHTEEESKMKWKELESKIEELGLKSEKECMQFEAVESVGIPAADIEFLKRIKVGDWEDEIGLLTGAELKNLFTAFNIELVHWNRYYMGTEKEVVVYYERWNRYGTGRDEEELAQKVDKLVLDFVNANGYRLFIGDGDSGIGIDNEWRGGPSSGRWDFWMDTIIDLD